MTLGYSKPLEGRVLARAKAPPYWMGTGAAVTLLAVSGIVNYFIAKKAERDNPPTGKFIEINGVWLHYVEEGEGEPLVLLHGNGSMIQDFGSSGLINMAAKRFRVIAFDRPGYGYSDRPRGSIWTPEAQADLLYRALKRLGVADAVILGHSWGASVAVALALKHPDTARSLVLASGYYFPTVRSDVVVMSGPALPFVGAIWSYTIAPLISRVMWPLASRKLFSPNPVPVKFKAFPKEMAFRPSQIRASAAEAALIIPDAFAYRKEYRKLKMSVVIIAGEEDQLVEINQSAQLHREIPQSTLHRVPGVGHMVHQSETYQVMAAIDEAAGPKRRNSATDMVSGAT
jgi:pimeloyl-ACP methyl ester carboxylesterase